MSGRVVSIVTTPAGVDRKPADRYARVPAAAVTLVADHGIEGDLKAGTKKRHLNVMAAETLAALAAEGFRTAPGEMGEQVVVEGVAVDGLEPGTRLALGGAVVEVTERRTGCGRFEAIQGKPAGAAARRLGVMAKVVTGGALRVGDAAGLP